MNFLPRILLKPMAHLHLTRILCLNRKSNDVDGLDGKDVRLMILKLYSKNVKMYEDLMREIFLSRLVRFIGITAI